MVAGVHLVQKRDGFLSLKGYQQLVGRVKTALLVNHSFENSGGFLFFAGCGQSRGNRISKRDTAGIGLRVVFGKVFSGPLGAIIEQRQNILIAAVSRIKTGQLQQTATAFIIPAPLYGIIADAVFELAKEKFFSFSLVTRINEPRYGLS